MSDLQGPAARGAAAGSTRNAALDGLRGLAAAAVALCHFISAFELSMLDGNVARAHFGAAPWIAGSPLVLLYDPDLGVAVFFVLSGFVLAASCLAKPASFGELAIRRWLRLSLPVLAASVFVWAIAKAGLLHNHAAGRLAGSAWLDQHYRADLFWSRNSLTYHAWFSFWGMFAGAYPASNDPLWTIPIEMFGSLGLFAAYCLPAAWRPCRGVMLSAALVVAALAWRSPYVGFAWGAALFEISAMVRGGIWRLGDRSRWAMGLLLMAGGAAAGGMPYVLSGAYLWVWRHSYPAIAEPTLLIHRLGALCLVAAALSFVPFQRVLDGRVCQFLGRVSFMLYLLHVPLIASLGSWVVVLGAPGLGYNVAVLAALALVGAATLGLAMLGTAWVDVPLVRLSRRVAAGVARGSVVAGQAMTVWRRAIISTTK